jgi:soluble lytic murein transglycosylase-like protein
MQCINVRHLAFAILLALPVQPALAHGHYSHSAYHHHRAHHAYAAHHTYAAHHRYHHHHYARRHGQSYAVVRGHNSGAQFSSASGSGYSGMVAQQAAANGVPASLVHRVIMRESRYNPRAVSKGNYGIMQIRLGTARAMGYSGSAAGLLDPNTNMTYAVKYLAGAYRAAGGNESRAVALYASGYGGGGAHVRARPQQAQMQTFGFSPYAFGAASPVRVAYYGQSRRVRHHRHGV